MAKQEKNLEQLRRSLTVLGQPHTIEIINCLGRKTKYIKQIAKEIEAPCSTVQKRVGDMNDAGLVTVKRGRTEDYGKSIRKVTVTNFQIHLSSPRIRTMMMEGLTGD